MHTWQRPSPFALGCRAKPPAAPKVPLTEEQKAALNAKYGKIERPKPDDLVAIANSGCKMQ